MRTPPTDDMVCLSQGVIQTSTVLGGAVSYFVLSKGVTWGYIVTLNSVGLDCSQAVLRGSRNLVIRMWCTLIKCPLKALKMDVNTQPFDSASSSWCTGKTLGVYMHVRLSPSPKLTHGGVC